MQSTAYVVATGALRGRSHSFFKFGWSEGVSEVVSMLKSIGSSKNGPDKCVCKTTGARHGLASAVLVLACLASYSGFIATASAAAVPQRLLGAPEGKL